MEKALVAINLINYLSVNLKSVDEFFLYKGKDMGFSEDFIKEELKHKEEFYQEVTEKLVEVANKLGDALNGLDAVDEELIAITTPMFNIINNKAK